MADTPAPAAPKAPAAAPAAPKAAAAWKADGAYHAPGKSIPVTAKKNGANWDLTKEGDTEPFCTECPSSPEPKEGWWTPNA